MGILILKEIKRHILSLKGVISATLFLLCAGLLLTLNNMRAGYSGLEAVLSLMTLAVAILIPVVVSNSISDERKWGTDKYIESLPFTKTQIFMSKLLGALGFLLIPTAILAVYPFVLAMYGDVSFIHAFAGLLMFVLFELLLVAFALMLSSFFGKAWRSMLAYYITLVAVFLLGAFAVVLPQGRIFGLVFFLILAFLIGFITYISTRNTKLLIASLVISIAVPLTVFLIAPSCFEGSVESFLKALSPFRRFDPIVFGLFDLRSFVFFGSVAALLVYIALQIFKKNRAKVNKKAQMISFVLALVVLFANVSLFAVPDRIAQVDVTKYGTYQISNVTKDYLASMDNDITVYLLNPNGSDEKLYSYINRYCELDDNIRLVEVDIDKDSEFCDKYNLDVTQVSAYSAIVESDKRYTYIDSNSYFCYSNEKLGFSDMSLEEYNYLCAQYMQYYSMIAGNASYEDQAQTIAETLMSLQYDSVPSIKAESVFNSAIEYVCAEYIPAVYFLTGNGEELGGTLSELFPDSKRLDLSSVTEMPKDISMLIINVPESDYSAEEVAKLIEYVDRGGRVLVLTNSENLNMENLCRFLEYYGMSAEDGIVCEGDGEDKSVVEATVNTEHDALAALDGEKALAMDITDGASILLNAPQDSSLILTPILTTGENAYIGDNTEEKGIKVLAAVAEQSDGVNTSRIAWFTGDSVFDEIDPSSSEPETDTYVLVYVMSWLGIVHESKLAAPASVPYQSRIMQVEVGDIVGVGIVFIGIIPLAALGGGLLYIHIRRKRGKV